MLDLSPLATPGRHELPLVDPEAAAGELAGQKEAGAGGELRGDPGLVEPGGTHGAGFVAHFDPEDRQTPFAEGARLGAEDLDQDRGRFAGFKRRQLPHLAVAVAVRDAVEEVADGADPGFRGRLGQFRADPVEDLNRRVEDAGAGPVDRGVAKVGAARLALAGERAQRYWAASSHHQLG